MQPPARTSEVKADEDTETALAVAEPPGPEPVDVDEPTRVVTEKSVTSDTPETDPPTLSQTLRRGLPLDGVPRMARPS